MKGVILTDDRGRRIEKEGDAPICLEVNGVRHDLGIDDIRTYVTGGGDRIEGVAVCFKVLPPRVVKPEENDA